MVYSTFLGGGDDDSARAIAADRAGNAYVAGVTRSTDFPARSAGQISNAGGADAFVAKLDPRGRALRYATYLGGSGDDGASAIAVSASGVAALTGHTDSADYPLAAGGAQRGGAFVSRLIRSGAGLAWSTTLGGGEASGLGIAAGPARALTVTGRSGGADGAALVTRLAAPAAPLLARRPVIDHTR